MDTRVFLLTLSGFLFPVYVGAQTANGITAEEVLAKYEQSLVSINKKVAFEAVVEIAFEGDYNPVMPSQQISKLKIYRNGPNFDVIFEETAFHSEDEGTEPRTHRAGRAILTEVQYMRASGDFEKPVDYLSIDNRAALLKGQIRGAIGLGRGLDGDAVRDSGKSYPDIMRESSTLKLRDKMELVDGHETYVLEVQGKYGEHVFWIDPKFGFNPRRIVSRKTGDDLADGKSISIPPPPIKGRGEPIIPWEAISLDELLIDSIKIEKVGDVFVPVEAEIKWLRKFANGQSCTLSVTHKRTGFDFNPDFDAIGAFVMDVPEGTRVFYTDSRAGQIAYEWRNGKVVTKIDDVFLDLIDGEIDAIKNDAESKTVFQDPKKIANPDKKTDVPDATINSLSVDREQNEPADPFRILLALLIGLVIIAAVGMVLFSRSRRNSDDKP